MALVVYLGIVMASVAQLVANKRFGKLGGSARAFNALKALSAFVLMGIMSLPQMTLHGPTILYGGLYGAALCLSMYSGYQAICMGPRL